MADKSFEGKVAIVTGGGSGMGRATAMAFAQAGARVVIADVNMLGGEETLAAIGAAGGDAKFIQTDVSDAQSVAALVQQTVAVFGRLDCAFNNAAINMETAKNIQPKPTDEWDEDIFDRTWSVNARGVFLCMKYEIRQMREQGGGGAIVNTASVEGLKGVPGSAGYATSKHAVIALTKIGALQYAPLGIRVNAICPGMIRTPLSAPLLEQYGEQAFAGHHPIGRIGEPSEIAEAVLWLCSDKASFVLGQALAVDGGLSGR